jgi:hypothetical protein
MGECNGGSAASRRRGLDLEWPAFRPAATGDYARPI